MSWRKMIGRITEKYAVLIYRIEQKEMWLA
jgi:hypothetical protein